MKPPKKKQKLTAAEIKKAAAERKEKARKRQHIRAIKDTFVNSGFRHLDKMSKTDFSFKGKGCDFDDVFVLENVLVLVEHTAHNEDQVSKHLVGKSIIFGYINSDPSGFAKYARENFPEIAAALNAKYLDHDIQVRIVYFSLYPLKKDTKAHIQSVQFLDFPQLKYFLLLSRAIKGQSDDSVDAEVIERYVEFCTKEINKFSGAVKDTVDDHRWTASRIVPDKLLTTTIVNGMVHCLRRLCVAGKLSSNESYKASLVGLNEFEFSKYTSSHYNEMGVDMAAEFFKV